MKKALHLSKLLMAAALFVLSSPDIILAQINLGSAAIFPQPVPWKIPALPTL